MTDDDRREFPRLRAPAFWKPARLDSSTAQLVDVGLGGIRVYSDERLNVDDRLDLTLFGPGGREIEVTARVAWVRELTSSEAAYDIGLEFEGVAPEVRQRLHALLAAVAT